ncbi:hypothetical protein FJ970_02790 [Mesorhizobium sp. B2-1-8]|uniref:hypothetical protein n=1 Tax=Mesorhizobium sp. B2-1-8 TaxID=2589967 RepID=UPI001129E122|nr:hypothetical protein [Mesorhizobium sp. B2-1-8]UCI19916.1 hypothetical protein FJ970_02790 [Mesorhizobium sp. B2-1-8]
MASDIVERDLKRFDDATSTFEKTAVVLGFVNLFLAIWARAPGLQINPASAVGLSVSGFNVGYAIIFGPLTAVMTLVVYLSLLRRRHLLRRTILAAKVTGQNKVSPGDRLALDNFNQPGAGGIAWVADRGWRILWYFIIPPTAALIALRRFCDLVPDEAAKAWDLQERIGFLFLSLDGWQIRPLLPDRALEGAADLMAQLPYIYAPLESWIQLGLFLFSCLLARRATLMYFASGG